MESGNGAVKYEQDFNDIVRMYKNAWKERSEGKERLRDKGDEQK